MRSKHLALILALAACKASSKDGATKSEEKPQATPGQIAPITETSAGEDESRDGDRADRPMKKTVKDDAKEREKGEWQHANAAESPAATTPEPDNVRGPGGAGSKGGGESTTRAWFPETFLFAPIVVTDDTGQAAFDVRVPDRLTTWRVLALAHARNGAQGGAVTSFLGTLPIYVDPVVPPTLVVGDDVKIPIQIINTTAAPIATTLSITADNATVTGASGARTIPGNSSRIEYARVRADHAGTITLEVRLGTTDAVLRTIAVVPSGRPVTTTRSGTLAAPRKLTIPGVAGADPTTDHVRLQAFPGALALLRSELGVSTARSGVADDAYALLLAGRATSLLATLGDKADPDAVRELGIVTGQRAIRHARNLDVATATALTEAALAHPDNPVLQRLGQRAADFLAHNQLPDGTFAGADGWTVQRVLVATADAVRAVRSAMVTPADRQRATAVTVRAAGAFERMAIHVEDGYTAAAILASGAVTGELAGKLREKVNAAIQTDADTGAKFLAVGEGVVRPDDTAPSRADATALAVLALQGDPTAPLADLGATLLGSYSLVRGWGDGRTNLIAMRAVIELFKDPVPANVEIKLLMDGVQVATGVLDRDKLREVLTLDAAAPGLAGEHVWEVVATPPVPGLGYSLALESWVPWDAQATQQGVELALPTAVTGAVGKPTPIAITAIAPSGMELRIEHALPTGVQVDTPSLDALVEAGTIERYVAADGSVELWVPALEPGAVFKATYRVVPTLAGTLHTTASVIEAGTTTFHVPPTVWTIK